MFTRPAHSAPKTHGFAVHKLQALMRSLVRSHLFASVHVACKVSNNFDIHKRKATNEIPPFSRNDLACYSITNCDFVGVADKIAVILMMRPSFRLKGGILSGTLGLVHQNLFSPLTHSYCALLSPFSVPRSSCRTF
jgi:hypothetical protein